MTRRKGDGLAAEYAARRPTHTLFDLAGQLGPMPLHGPGCQQLAGRSTRFPGEHRYICQPGCPRAAWLAAADAPRA